MKELLRKYRKRVAREGIIKSILVGIAFGFASVLLSAAVMYFVPAKTNTLLFAILIPTCLFIFTAVTFTLSLYFYKFRPSTESVARRIDELGLDERIVTMTELADDTSYIAMRQREDALKSLESVKTDMIKLRVPKKMAVTAAVALLIGGGAFAFNMLSALNIVPSGHTIIEGNKPENQPVIFEIVYDVDGEGEIIGNAVQSVEKGGATEKVIAEAKPGWTFIGWMSEDFDEEKLASGDLGLDSMERRDTDVSSDMVIIAIFEELDDDDEFMDADGDPDPNAPADPDGEPKPTPPKKEQNKPNIEGSKKDQRDNPANQVYDGRTYYGDDYGEKLSEAIDQMNGDDNYNDKEKSAVSDYFDSISEGGDNGGEGTETPIVEKID